MNEEDMRGYDYAEKIRARGGHDVEETKGNPILT